MDEEREFVHTDYFSIARGSGGISAVVSGRFPGS
jgi:hypothetical protein